MSDENTFEADPAVLEAGSAGISKANPTSVLEQGDDSVPHVPGDGDRVVEHDGDAAIPLGISVPETPISLPIANVLKCVKATTPLLQTKAAKTLFSRSAAIFTIFLASSYVSWRSGIFEKFVAHSLSTQVHTPY